MKDDVRSPLRVGRPDAEDSEGSARPLVPRAAASQRLPAAPRAPAAPAGEDSDGGVPPAMQSVEDLSAAQPAARLAEELLWA